MSNFQGWRWLVAKTLPYFAVIIFCGSVAIIWVIIRPSSNPDVRPTVEDKATSSTLPSEAVAQSDPPDVVADKRAIVSAARGCLEKYYLRDPKLLDGSSDEVTKRYHDSLRPFVTDDFLSSYTTAPLSIPADYGFRDADGVQRVQNVEFTGDGDPESGVEADVTISVSLPGQKAETYVQPVVLTLDKTEDGWRVTSLIEE